MHIIVNNPAALEAYLRGIGRGVVMFDGRSGAGKSTLMLELAGRLQCAAIDGDDFLVREQGVFLDALRIADLRDQIKQAVATSPMAIVATICARAVAARVGHADAKYVYVERTSLARLQQSVDNFDADLDASPEVLAGIRRPPLEDEVEAYHADYDPRRMADIAYVWACD